MSFILQTDGGSRGNPGPSAAGWVISKMNGTNKESEILKDGSKFLGIQTNNFAEYTAIIEGLKDAIELKIDVLDVLMDSELAVKQINKIYKIKNSQIKIFYDEISKLKKDFKTVTFSHVYREKNKHADRLVNECLDKETRN